MRRGATFGPEMPLSGLVPPLPFLPAATVCSTWHFSGLLHPETDPGVRQVAGRWGPLARPGVSGWRPESLAVHTSIPPSPRGSWCRHCHPGPRSIVRRRMGAGPVWRGELKASFNHSHWRSTLRSFPLAFSSAASSAPRVRTPITSTGPSDPFGKPESTKTSGALFGHGVRVTATLALSSLITGGSASCRSASGAAQRVTGPDLSTSRL